MVKNFLRIAIAIGASHCIAQPVVINEVMYAPIKPEPEWIELFNPSDSTVSTAGWKISNHLRTYSLLADTIPSGGYLVLTKDSANFLKIKYQNSNAHILQTILPSLVNTGDEIVLRDSMNTIIDSLKYSPYFGGGGGVSLERIDYSSATDSSNFGSCIDSLGATPGSPNSIRRRDHDLAIESVTYQINNQNDLSITAILVNRGRKAISDGIVSLSSNSGIPIVQFQITSPVLPFERQPIDLQWQNADYGRTMIPVIVSAPQDELHSNDTLRKAIYLPIPRNAVIINEIMPTPASSSSEWIELYNNSTSIVHMDSTALGVGSIDTIYKFRIDSLALPPKHYALIDASTKLFSQFPSLEGREGVKVLGKSSFGLADSGSEVILLNKDGSIIDSLHYYSSWHSPNITNHSGISLERRLPTASSTDRSNWSSSLDPRGSTPLEKNSYGNDTTGIPPAIDVKISPNPFSPDGDGFNDAANISIALPSDQEEVVSAKLYDLRGKLRSTIALNQRIYRTESLHFEGKDDNGIILPIGLYTLVVESEHGSFTSQRTGVVIMKKPR